MSKQVILVMQNHYPFGQCQQMTTQLTKVLVRQKIALTSQNRDMIVSRGNFLRKLSNEHIIRIQSILQQQDSCHFLFEYVPIKIQTWISNINEQFIEGFRDQLIKLSNFLANNDIVTTFSLSNIGMDQNYNAKYFLGLGIQVDPTINREKLKSAYIRDIYNLFKPYLKRTSQQMDSPLKQITTKDKSNHKQTKNAVSSTQEEFLQKRLSGPIISHVVQPVQHLNFKSIQSTQKQLKKSIQGLQINKMMHLNPQEKYNRLVNITVRLNEIKSSLSSLQANKKNDDAIQMIEEQMKNNNDSSKIQNILEQINQQNKNVYFNHRQDMSDHILKQFMDVLDDEDKQMLNFKEFQSGKQTAIDNQHNFSKSNHWQTQKKKVGMDISNDLHRRVSDAINHSMRVIDKFKNSPKQ